ncbi:MAG: acyloxyacyl hydrolase [Magnetospirillum sp.]|nr:acyloxyacyl hydrolase [Magnetospirillum sp.]
MKNIIPLSLLFVLAAVPAQAGVSEIRLGIFSHDIGFLGHSKEGGVDANGEVLLDSPKFLIPLWAPRPHFGVSLNTQGDTSQAYGGLTWTFEPTRWFFVDFSLGGAVHNGELDFSATYRKELGSRVLFRESLSLGYRIDAHNSISVAFDHESNARLAEHNEGLNNLGVRWGYRF